jgi:hypothetical protein
MLTHCPIAFADQMRLYYDLFIYVVPAFIPVAVTVNSVGGIGKSRTPFSQDAPKCIVTVSKTSTMALTPWGLFPASRPGPCP